MSGSMMGSGIYCQEVTLEVVCHEDGCDDCTDICQGRWSADFVTDDWGIVNDKVTCPVCKHTYRFRREA